MENRFRCEVLEVAQVAKSLLGQDGSLSNNRRSIKINEIIFEVKG